MARGKTPRKEKEQNYEDLGRKGRRTGVELKDTGIRDENGMEPIPSFSSPVKLAVPTNGMQHDMTYTVDDTMDLGQNTIEEPDIVTKTVRNERARLSIPRSVSPRKGLVNGSPRRSMPRSVGAMSSPSANFNKGTPTRLPSHPPANRRLDFSMDKTQGSAKSLSQKPDVPVLKPSKPASSARKGKNKRGPFDLDATDDEDDGTAGLTNGTEQLDTGDDDVMGEGNEAMMDYTQDQGDVQDQTMQSIEEEQPSYDPYAIAVEDEADVTSVAQVPEKKKPGRKPRQSGGANPDESSLSISTPALPRRGRPPKHPKTNGAAAQPQAPEPVMGPPKGRGKRKDPPAKEQNARPKAAKTVARAASVRAGSVGPRAQSIVQQRSETPATDSGALITRSGRHSLRPLASWRGEKVVLGRRPDADTLPGFTDIIRVDEIMPPPKGRPSYRRARPRATPRLEDVEEDEEERDEWERGNGIMQATVMAWDQEINNYREEDVEETEIAYSFEAIEMRDIAGATFKFAKTLSLPFFGSGMVHLPPGGEKRVKNARKMQMVFFVFYGRVTVGMGTPMTTFSIGKGGQWQVPRGNFYSILNESTTQPARMFFSQGCEWTSEALDEGLPPAV